MLCIRMADISKIPYFHKFRREINIGVVSKRKYVENSSCDEPLAHYFPMPTVS